MTGARLLIAAPIPCPDAWIVAAELPAGFMVLRSISISPRSAGKTPGTALVRAEDIQALPSQLERLLAAYARCDAAGRLTASAAHCAASKGKGSAEAVTRRDLRYKLACERITGQPEPDDFLGYDMRRGIEQEPRALAAYEALTGLTVLRTGFIAHNSLSIGCSLDGYVGEFERIVEFKASKASLHIRHWHARDEFIREHWQPIAHILWTTGAPVLDLVSFNPTVPPRLRLLRVELPRSDAKIPEYVGAAERFLVDVDRTASEILALAEGAA